MAEYGVTIARSARKELMRLAEPLASRIVDKIGALSSNPRPPGCRKLEGADDLWRIRIGDYRVVYSVDYAHRVVDVSAIRHRSDAYR